MSVESLTFGSLFAGIGGFDLGLERAGMTPLWQVEIDDYCNQVLAKHWPDVKRYKDVRGIHGVISHATEIAGTEQKRQRENMGGSKEFAGNGENWQVAEEPCPDCLKPIDLICGGFPCQPFSAAGKQRGADDDRNLWPQFKRIIDELRPRWVLAENVPGIRKLYLDTVLSDLEGMGYAWEAAIIPACAVDAPHRRDRLWIVAHANGKGLQIGTGQTTPPVFGTDTAGRARGDFWLPEPNVGRVAHGIPRRVDRLRALGNAVVPQVVEHIGRLIMDVEFGGKVERQ